MGFIRINPINFINLINLFSPFNAALGVFTKRPRDTL
jgi:hypothetical protein